MKNDNLNICFSIGSYAVTILKFSYEQQNWNIPAHAHSATSYEIHYIPQGKGTLISGGKPTISTRISSTLLAPR